LGYDGITAYGRELGAGDGEQGAGSKKGITALRRYGIKAKS